MSRWVMIAGLSTLLGGCGIFPPNHQGGITASVPPEEYGRRLCTHLEPEEYASCLNQVSAYFDQPRPDDIPVDHVTSGPFAVMMDQQVYVGNYKSSPFDAWFRVSNGRNNCRGSYNAAGGSIDAVYDVYCDDGRSGWADVIRDHGGRNGIGKIALDDGTQGNIVFGYTALGKPDLYPYRP